MSELEAKQDPNFWDVENFRLTAFLSPSAQILEPNWWKALTGKDPDRTTLDRRIGLQQEEGKFKDEKIEGTLVLTIQPTRIDWQLVPLLDIPASGFSIGSFTDSLEGFLNLMQRWIKSAPQIQRLAFGAILNKPVNSQKEGYDWVSNYLPSVKLDDDSSEFLYQINRPRKSSAISGLSINRLSKWNVNLVGFILNTSNPERYITKPLQFFVGLELDINTTPDFPGELPSENLPQVFLELVELGKEIVIKGDIK